MKHSKLFALGGIVAVLAAVFSAPPPRVVLMEGLIGFADATQRVYEDPCSFFHHSDIPLWQRLDPTCPQCL